MLGIWSFALPLLLSTVALSEFPDFGEDYDWYDEWNVCEGDACAHSNTYIYFDKDVKVPNRSVTYEEYEYFEVDTSGLLADCAPSLSVGDIATRMKSCRDVDYKYQTACNYRAKGWLDKDGETIKEGLDEDFKEIAGAPENIMKCFGWDGVAEYEYGYYDYYDYYYNYLEESDDIQVRNKRDQISNLPEFLTQSNKKKRSIKNKGNGESKTIKKPKNGKGRNGGKHRGKFGKNRKNKNGNKRKSKHQGKKSIRRGGKQGSKSGKQRKKHSRKSGKSYKKSGKGSGNSKKKKHRSGKKGNERKNKNQKKKEEREKKKKEKKILKKIGYNSEPSEESLNKLRCVERAIMFGLEKCGEKIFQNLDIP